MTYNTPKLIPIGTYVTVAKNDIAAMVIHKYGSRIRNSITSKIFRVMTSSSHPEEMPYGTKKITKLCEDYTYKLEIDDAVASNWFYGCCLEVVSTCLSTRRRSNEV